MLRIRSAVSRPGVPEEIEFQTKPEIALEQIRQAMEQKVPAGVVLADAGYGNSTPFRNVITELGLHYVVGVESSTTVWEPGQQPLPAPPRKPGRGAAPKRLQRSADHQPLSVKQLAFSLPASAWKEIGWRHRRSPASPSLSFSQGGHAEIIDHQNIGLLQASQ